MLIRLDRWISFLVVSFGSICAGIGGTHNFAGVAALRFFLGAAEAGVFPGERTFLLGANFTATLTITRFDLLLQFLVQARRESDPHCSILG